MSTDPLSVKDHIALECISKGRNSPNEMRAAFYEYGFHHWDIYSTLKRLVKRGRIIRIGKGAYETREAVEASIKDIADRRTASPPSIPTEEVNKI